MVTTNIHTVNSRQILNFYDVIFLLLADKIKL